MSGAPVKQELQPADRPDVYKGKGNQLHANECSGGQLVPVPVPSPTTPESRLPALPAKKQKQKLMDFRYDDDLGMLEPSFLSIANPQLGVLDPNFTSLTARRNHRSQDQLHGANAMAELPSLAMNTSRDEQEKIVPMTPPTRVVTSLEWPVRMVGLHHYCSICGQCFKSGQALGGHKGLHRGKNAGEVLSTWLLGSNNVDKKGDEDSRLELSNIHACTRNDVASDVDQPSTSTGLSRPTKMYRWL